MEDTDILQTISKPAQLTMLEINESVFQNDQLKSDNPAYVDNTRPSPVERLS